MVMMEYNVLLQISCIGGAHGYCDVFSEAKLRTLMHYVIDCLLFHHTVEDPSLPHPKRYD